MKPVTWRQRMMGGPLLHLADYLLKELSMDAGYITAITDTYSLPKMSSIEIEEMIKNEKVDLLRDFSETFRKEFETKLRI